MISSVNVAKLQSPKEELLTFTEEILSEILTLLSVWFDNRLIFKNFP